MPKAPFFETGNRLREARREKHWSQSDLATATRQHTKDGKGLTPGAIGNYEQGIRRPSRRSAMILEKVFGLPAPYFLGEIDRREAQLLKALRAEN